MKQVLKASLALVLVCLFLYGCSPFKRIGDTTTYKSADGSMSVSDSGNLPWPKSDVGNLPEFKGNIVSVIDTNDAVSVIIEDVSESEYETYIKKVKDQGWEAVYEQEFDKETFMFIGSKDDLGVNIQLSLDSKGKGTMIISCGVS